MELILHITTFRAWAQAEETGRYHTPSLEEEGFIHCSDPDQVVGVANTLYRGERELILLAIDPESVDVPIRYEDCYDTGQAFPHIYGPLNTDAVVHVLPFESNDDGTFSLPPALMGGALRYDYPILEFDPSPRALIEPDEVLEPLDITEHCVLCFFQDVISHLREEGQLELVRNLGSEIGHNPVYEMEVDGQRLAVCHPGVGAPLAAAFMDELIALGCGKFIACGGAGVLEGDLTLGHLIVPTGAVRDEGTSYHYLPPAREVDASPEAVSAIEQILQRDNVDYVTGKTWTTDGFYRETTAKIQLRRAQGCLTVEMEAAAFFAVARFRGVIAGQILYGGDDISSNAWDSRYWQQQASVREKVFWLAAEACLRL